MATRTPITGTDKYDVIDTEQDNDTIYAGAGDDAVYVYHRNVLVYGENGHDRIQTYSSRNADNATIHGGNGDDTIYADNKNWLVYGDVGDDVIFAWGDGVTAHGGIGNDYITKLDNTSTLIYGDEGNDTVYSGERACYRLWWRRG